MESIISARGICKTYGEKIALDHIDLDIPAGRILGLIGPNGAGKTTLLKGILGLTGVDGQLAVLGLDPVRERVRLLENVSFIADTAVLPRWLKVSEAVDYLEGVHPRFSREKCMTFLSKTTLDPNNRVRDLSKGMVTQLHLALIMAIDSKLLVLDEPTLGLDIIYRKQFYQSLLDDYYDEQKTIIITTHQVEEIEGVLTDLMFINRGKIVLESSMENVAERFVEVQVEPALKAQALAFNPIHLRSILGGYSMIFENVAREQLQSLGRLATPSLADLFVAKIQPNLTSQGVVA